jgi:ribosomal protein L9
MDSMQKLEHLKQELVKYEGKLAEKLKYYRGVIHEDAASELKHAQVEVYRSMVYGLQNEIKQLEEKIKNESN